MIMRSGSTRKLEDGRQLADYCSVISLGRRSTSYGCCGLNQNFALSSSATATKNKSLKNYLRHIKCHRHHAMIDFNFSPASLPRSYLLQKRKKNGEGKWRGDIEKLAILRRDHKLPHLQKQTLPTADSLARLASTS
jgi:hypothetical protein